MKLPKPTAEVTSDGGETELTDKALPLKGKASDPAGTQRDGEGEIRASGVRLVEIVGTGPDKQPIEPVAAVDDSDAEQEPWSVWSLDFLPTRSGEYDLDVRVTGTMQGIMRFTTSVRIRCLCRSPSEGRPLDGQIRFGSRNGMLPSFPLMLTFHLETRSNLH